MTLIDIQMSTPWVASYDSYMSKNVTIQNLLLNIKMAAMMTCLATKKVPKMKCNQLHVIAIQYLTKSCHPGVLLIKYLIILIYILWQ